MSCPAQHRSLVRSFGLRVLPGIAAAVFGIEACAQSDHWAYRLPTRLALPVDRQAEHPVDAFVRARLADEGMETAPRAEPARLLRRVYLDLIGLPPTVEEVDAFLADPSDEAFARVVDRLLASPRFGEHHARSWLDLARYADSNGFQADQLRDSWAYRDWVIDALNQDMPFDRFSIEQLAGDLLPDATLSQQIATGFHRTVTCNVEAGVHPEANRVQQVFDRVNTTATVWLGTTMECAQCHDHKYDPFTQRDYYRLFAFFNNTPLEVRNPFGEEGVRYDFYGPKIDLPLTAERQAERDRLVARRAELLQQRDSLLATLDAGFDDRVRDLGEAVRTGAGFEILGVAGFESTGGEDHELLDDGSVLVGGQVPSTTTYRIEVDTDLTGITAFRVETLTHPSLPGTGPGRGDVERPNFILSEFGVEVARRTGNGPDSPQTVELAAARADHEQSGWEVGKAIDGRPETGWAIGGGFFADHSATFETAAPVGEDGGTRLVFTLDQNYGRGRTIGRVRISAFVGDPAVLELPESIRAILGRDTRSPDEDAQLHVHLREHHPGASRLARDIEALDRRIAGFEPRTTLVMVEEEDPRDSFVMRRGDYQSPGDAVTAGTPEVLHAFRDEWPRNRLGLARWLVSPDNPLVARVTVNRFWSQLFGQGLVTSEEDFGLRSEAPSHPELLDWLAVEFVESGWSMKHMLRLLVTSETYKQSSRRRDDRDAGNRLLARGPRFRMTAEMIRDHALAASGLLSLEVGGPPVYPPQPDGLWRQIGRNEPKYVTATGADRFRRGIYVIWRRAAPYPSFVLFDGPDRSSCHPTRSRTNTPMQALALMNDEAYVEAALGLARLAATRRAEPRQTLTWMFRRVLARQPADAELAHLLGAFAEERARFQADPEGARKVVDGLPSVPVDRAFDRAEVAALFHVATILLNVDEAVSKG